MNDINPKTLSEFHDITILRISIPYLKFYWLVANGDHASSILDTNRQVMDLLKAFIHEL